MHCTIASNNPIDYGHGPTRLGFDYGLQGSTSGYDKQGMTMVGSLVAPLPFYLGVYLAPADVEFDCVNKPQYKCREKVNRAGARCSECRRLGRGIGGSSAPHLIDTYDHDGTEMPKHGARLGDVFDCVNKPQYHCPDKVDRAGAKCSLCHLRRGMGGNSAPHPVDSYYRCGTEMPKQDAEPGDAFDCVNKPQYDCEESVDRAGARCSKCTALNRGMGGRYYNQYSTGRPTHDTGYDEGDPQGLSHNTSRLNDD